MSAPTTRSVLLDRRFVRHVLEMVAAMVVGMVVLGVLWPDLHGRTELHALVMATNMTVGMAAWMAWRRHGPISIVEMSAAMYLSFAVLLPPFWAGWISEGAVLTAGHVLMLPAMVLVMLRRPAEYS